MRDIGKWSSVNENGRSLEVNGGFNLATSSVCMRFGLNRLAAKTKSLLNSVFHKNSQCSTDTEIIGSNRLPRLARGYYHISESDVSVCSWTAAPFTHVIQISCQGENSHTFAGNCDVESSFSREPFLSRRLPNRN